MRLLFRKACSEPELGPRLLPRGQGGRVGRGQGGWGGGGSGEQPWAVGAPGWVLGVGAGQRGPAPAVQGALGRLSRPLLRSQGGSSRKAPGQKRPLSPQTQTEGGLPAVSGSARPTPTAQDGARRPPHGPCSPRTTGASGGTPPLARCGTGPSRFDAPLLPPRAPTPLPLALGDWPLAVRDARRGRAAQAHGVPLRIVGIVVLWPPRGRGRA